MSFKGPQILQEKIDVAKNRKIGIERIDPKEKPRLEQRLKESIQREIDDFKQYFEQESNEHMRKYYQHNLDHLLWQLSHPSNFFDPDRLKEYLDFVGRTSGNCFYFPEPMLCLMAVMMYNLEIKADGQQLSDATNR